MPFGLLEFRVNIQSCELIQHLLDLLGRGIDLSQLLPQNNKTLTSRRYNAVPALSVMAHLLGRQDMSPSNC
jgi:hypothetical protein